MNPKTFGILVVLGLIASSFLILFWHRASEERPEDTIQEQWRAISNRQLTKAYFAYTSKEYQEFTTLKEFKELVNYLPQPIESNALELIELEDDFPFKAIEGLIQGVSDLKLYYEMLLHNGVWKVDRMLLLEEAHTQMGSRIGNLTRRRPEFESGLPLPKQPNLYGWAMQADSKSVASRRRQKPILESIWV